MFNNTVRCTISGTVFANTPVNGHEPNNDL